MFLVLEDCQSREDLYNKVLEQIGQWYFEQLGGAG